MPHTPTLPPKNLPSRGRVFRVSGPLFTLIYPPQTTSHTIVIVASKKVSKRAVDRNKMKRRVRAIMRIVAPKPGPPGVLGVYIQKQALAASFIDTKTHLTELIGRLVQQLVKRG